MVVESIVVSHTGIANTFSNQIQNLYIENNNSVKAKLRNNHTM